MSKIMIIHPEGNINNNPNLSGIIEILCGLGFEVDIFSRKHAALSQEPPCAAARIFSTELIDPLDTAVLFAPGRQLSHDTILDIENTFKAYDLVIGIDRGIIEASIVARILKVPYGLISYEIYFACEAGIDFKIPEITACEELSFAVCQDRVRAACLADENHIPATKIVNIPVAGRSIVRRERSHDLHKALGIGVEKKIAIYIGEATAKWAGFEELLESTARWDESWVLVLHHRYGKINGTPGQRLGNLRNVFISPFPSLPLHDLHILLSSCDLGIAFYIPQMESPTLQERRNLLNIGMASGKIATYLQHGLPLLVNEIGEMSDHVRQFELGEVVDNFSEIGSILSRTDITKLKNFSDNCYDYFRDKLGLDRAVEPLIDIISGLIGHGVRFESCDRQQIKTNNHSGSKGLPRITIITPSFNQAKYLEECIESILSQNYPNLEYIIMDGGSTDGSVEIIKKYEKHLTYWQSQPDGGQYQAINDGFHRSTGEIMGWLNSDDKFHPNGLSVIADVFTQYPKVDFITGTMVGFDKHGEPTRWGSRGQTWSRSMLLNKQNVNNYLFVMQEATYWRRCLWDKAGSSLNLSCNLAADFELWARFSRFTQLYSVDALIAGFRWYSSEQRSQSQIAQYVRECELTIDTESRMHSFNPHLDSVCPEIISYPIKTPSNSISAKLQLPRISIITPSYNQAEYLEECIESILSQNYPNLEYIIMDGGSTDGSVEIIKKYEKHLSYWQSQPDGGQYAAINEGFRRSTGEIMTWLNSDDKYHSGALHLVELAFSAMPQAEWITGRPTAWDSLGTLTTVFDHVPLWSQERLLFHGKDDYYIQQESTFWRRTLWDRAGGKLDTSWQLAADFELWCRFFNYSQLIGVDALLGGFRYHSGQKTDTMMERYEQEVLQIIDRERRSKGNQSVQSRPPAVVVDMEKIISAITPKLTPDAFSYFSYSRRPHFNWFEASAKKLFGSAVHPDYSDLKMYQDLLCYTFIVDNLPKGSRILEVGGCDSRVLKALKYDYECWNLDKLEGLGSGLTDVTPDGYRMIKAYMGDFSEDLPDGYFDFVFSISALEHVEETEDNYNNICRDMDRVMKTGAFSLHCFDVVVKPDSVWTNSFLPFLFRRYETINRFAPFEMMERDPSLYFMSEFAYNRGWENITKIPYKDFGRPLSCNILWQKPLDQRDSALLSLQDIVPDLSSLIACYCKENKNSFTSSETDRLQSAVDSPLDFLQTAPEPLSADNHTGKLIKQIMLSRHGKAIRAVLPKFRPYCLNYFPQMMVNILSDGTVTTCCFDAYGENRFGSIYEKELAEIWENDLPRVMQGDFYEYKRCLQCIGLPKWAPLVNEQDKKEKWLEWMNKSPNEIQIEITSHCNYACVSCPSTSIRQQRSAFLDLDKTFANIRSILKKTHKLNLYNYGEPLLHQGFSDFIRKCRAESSELVMELATNGMLLNEEVSRALIESRVDRIIVSVHGGPGTENMLKYSCHGADYDTVLNNVRQLLQLRKSFNAQVPKVSLRAILFNWNDNDEDMNRFRDDARALGLSATWGHYDTDNYHWIPDSGNQLASRKYMSGSAELKALIESREFFSPGLYEEECNSDTYCGERQSEEFSNVVVATSIAPGNIERQQKAIQSWLDYGFKVISVNIPTEIELLERSFPDVIFVKTERDGRELFGRPLVFLDDVFSALAATGASICGIINSDIHLKAGNGTKDCISREAHGALVIGHRIDVDRPDTVDGTVYRNGFDFFFFSRDICCSFPFSEFCLGTTWWDIWAPLTLLFKGVPVKQLITPLAYHVIHDNRWNENEWHANCERIIKLVCSEANGATRHAELLKSAQRQLQHQDYIGFFSVVRDYIFHNAEKISLHNADESLEPLESAHETVIKMPEAVSTATVPPGIRVSAIVSTYNAEKFFNGCILNLFGQTLYKKGQMEIIIINSGSEQDEESIARHYMETHDLIVYQRTERETLYAAWNRGIKLARGKYITHANTDDRHRSDAFEVMALALERNDVGLVYVDALMTTASNETYGHHTAGKAWLLPDFSIRQALLDCPFGCQVMWKISVHTDVGMFDASYKRAGDYEFFLRVALKAGAMHLPEVLALYHESPDNLSYQSPQEVIREVNRFIGDYRRQLPLEIIYPYLQHDSSPFAKAAALADFANNLMGACGFLFTDTHLGEALYRQALEILPQDVDILGNLIAACIVNGNTAEAQFLMQSAAPSPRLAYYKDMLKEGKSPELGLARLEHPGLNTMQAVKAAFEIRVPLVRPGIGPAETTIVIDGVIFQLQHGRPFGISRLWWSLLTELTATPLAGRIVLLDRGGTAPEIPGIKFRKMSPFSLGNACNETATLDQVCREEGGGLFVSTYYTYTLSTPSLLMLYDMIPERFDTVAPTSPNPEWRDKYHAIVNSTAFAAISSSTANDLGKFYPQAAPRPLTVVPCAVSEDFRLHSEKEIAAFKSANGIDRPYFLLVGRRDQHKNVGLFFQAFAQFPDRERYAIVMAGGGNELEPELRELAGPAAGYAGFFSDQDLSLVCSGAIALVYPSLYEGFGLPILEAMKSGCPVITCYNSSLPEVAGSAALYVGESDHEEMSRALLAVQQTDVRSYLIKRGLERARRFSWQKSAELMAEVLQKTVVTSTPMQPQGGY